MKKNWGGITVVAGLTLAACATNSLKTFDKTGFVNDPSEAASLSPTRSPAGEGDDPWTTWSKKGSIGGMLMLKKIREELFEKNLHDPHIDYQSYGAITCDAAATRFRTADGTCNDTSGPRVGAAGVAFGRNVPPAFIDQDAHLNLLNPNPAVISNELLSRAKDKNGKPIVQEVPFLNMLAASWIQFMNHDWLTHGRNMEQNPIRVPGMTGKDESASIVERTKENDHPARQYKQSFGKTTINEVTHWWDGSQVYGSSLAEQTQVRAFKGGKMRTVKVNGRELLPKDTNLNIANNKQNQGYEVTGFRDNWWVGLSMLHHLFVLEHNTIADMLVKKHVKFDAKTGKYTWTNGKEVLVLDAKGIDEQVFQTARLVNAALMAKIHTVEWTPAILANRTLKKGMLANWYGLVNPNSWKAIRHIPGLNKTDWNLVNMGQVVSGIVGEKTDNSGVPFSITEEFTSVYRLHSLLPETIRLKKLSNQRAAVEHPFMETRNDKSYAFMEKNDLKDLFYSFGTQKPGQIVLNNIPHFMQNLTIPGHGIMDLGMVDIIRDRERGVPRYNQFRRAIGLKPIKKYEDFFDADKPRDARQAEILKKLTSIYGKDRKGNDNVEMIDLLVGTLAEEVRPKNFGFGETQFQIFILMASRRLMADRFYTADYREEFYTKSGLQWIDNEGLMHQIIIRHMPELESKLKGIETAFNPWNN